jgi:hypothetical protein
MFRYLAGTEKYFGGTSRFCGTQVEKHCPNIRNCQKISEKLIF